MDLGNFPVDERHPEGGRVLRLALLLDSFRQPAWVHRTISTLLVSKAAEITVVVIEEGSPQPPRRGVRHFAGALKHLSFEIYRRLDAYWFKDRRPDPFAETDLHPLLATVPRGTPSETRDVDVALRFGSQPRPLPSSLHARFGVWSYTGGSQSNLYDDPHAPGFWEVLTGDPVTRSALQIDGASPENTRVIYQSFASTSTLSAWKNRRELYWKTAAFVQRKLRELAEFGPEALAQSTEESPSRHSGAPRNLQMLRYLPGLAGRYLATQLAAKTAFDQWFLAYTFSPRAHSEEQVPNTHLREFKRLIPPKDRMWADPFPIVHRGQYFVFLEELLFARNKGHISVMGFDGGGAPGRPELVLETANHLSYPFLLQWKGETFLVPESARAGDRPDVQGRRSVPVFRARSFPGDWVQETEMLEGLEVFDPTLAEIEGVWWLFCTQAEASASAWDELYLFHGPTPFGPWTPHRRNPVKSDVRSARPAGCLYRHRREWFRPAQNCSVRYGYAITINRIERLTPTEYAESPVLSILPDWAPNLIGTHTLNAAGRLTVADGRVRRRKWSPEPRGTG
jgi:hypothetical protein